MLDDAGISRALAITAHPDDVDFAAAPALTAGRGGLADGRLAEAFQVLDTA